MAHPRAELKYFAKYRDVAIAIIYAGLISYSTLRYVASDSRLVLMIWLGFPSIFLTYACLCLYPVFQQVARRDVRQELALTHWKANEYLRKTLFRPTARLLILPVLWLVHMGTMFALDWSDIRRELPIFLYMMNCGLALMIGLGAALVMLARRSIVAGAADLPTAPMVALCVVCLASYPGLVALFFAGQDYVPFWGFACGAAVLVGGAMLVLVREWRRLGRVLFAAEE